ncbi:hypothetical protein MtrunA17_Chr3g0099941 [Medicago truncatula]|uniref:Transmembrane protein n=1 Tax=Medicago truncatula TaxID=3880 RepID=A0A396INF3_MEDTR|nr:hypothetical protein MtrunA17_Chr3g0099941 [Medicago truncatula]
MVVAGGGRYGGGRSHRRQRWLQEATRMEGGTSSLFVVVVEVGSEKQEAVERGGGCCGGGKREETVVRWRDMARERVVEKGDEVEEKKKKKIGKGKNTVFLYGVGIVPIFLCLVIIAVYFNGYDDATSYLVTHNLIVIMMRRLSFYLDSLLLGCLLQRAGSGPNCRTDQNPRVAYMNPASPIHTYTG